MGLAKRVTFARAYGHPGIGACGTDDINNAYMSLSVINIRETVATHHRLSRPMTDMRRGNRDAAKYVELLINEAQVKESVIKAIVNESETSQVAHRIIGIKSRFCPSINAVHNIHPETTETEAASVDR
jgi:hypothetical protein